MRPHFSVCLLVCVALTACGGGPRDAQVLGTLERDRLELVAESNERIVEVAVREGDAVEAGAVLLKQELGAMQARLDRASAAHNLAERRLAELIKGPRSQEITEARAALEAARSSFETESAEYRRVQGVVTRKLLSESALDQARARRDSAAGRRDQAAARLELLIEGTRSEEVEQAQAALREAQAALDELETSASRYTVVAPRSGMIEALPYELGERPPAGAPVVVMLATGAPYARVHVPEPRRVEFTPGTRVRAYLDGREEPFEGVVRFVSAEAAFTPYYALTQEDRSRLSYRAEIDLTGPDAERMPTGIPVQVVLAEAAR